MTYPLCPVCRYQRRPAHVLALAMRAVAIPVRDAHEKLNQPTRQRDSQWALGRLDEAKNVAEAHEESCACVDPSDAEIARASDPHVTCPICSADVLIPDGTGAFYCRLCRARSAEALIESARAAPIEGDGFSIAPALPVTLHSIGLVTAAKLMKLAKGCPDEAAIVAAADRLASFRGTDADVRLVADVFRACGHGSSAKRMSDLLDSPAR